MILTSRKSLNASHGLEDKKYKLNFTGLFKKRTPKKDNKEKDKKTFGFTGYDDEYVYGDDEYQDEGYTYYKKDGKKDRKKGKDESTKGTNSTNSMKGKSTNEGINNTHNNSITNNNSMNHSTQNNSITHDNSITNNNSINNTHNNTSNSAHNSTPNTNHSHNHHHHHPHNSIHLPNHVSSSLPSSLSTPFADSIHQVLDQIDSHHISDPSDMGNSHMGNSQISHSDQMNASMSDSHMSDSHLSDSHLSDSHLSDTHMSNSNHSTHPTSPSSIHEQFVFESHRVSIDSAPYITVVPSNDNYTTTPYEGGYLSFTLECISLQNSEMTCDSGHTHVASPLASVMGDERPRELRSMLSVAGFSASHVPRSHEEEVVLDCDLDTESDVNFDPHCEESAHEYRYGGYHPVHKGETYYSNTAGRAYVILRKLGWGHFLTVWLARARDAGQDTDSYVAIKFVKLNKNYLEAAQDEIRILKALQNPIEEAHHLTTAHRAHFAHVPAHHQPGYAHVMKLLDDFEISGPNGHHICMVFEVLGENVLGLIGRYKQLHSQLRGLKKYNMEKGIENGSDKKEKSTKDSEKKDKKDGDKKKNGKNEFTGDYSDDSSKVDLLASPKNFFGKWDAKSFKKSTKSMLSLGMARDKDDEPVSPTAVNAPSLPVSAGTASISLSVETADGKRLDAMNLELLLKVIQKSRTCGGIPLNLVRVIVKQMLTAMDYIHHCGVIHTDLKPENILVEIKDTAALVSKLERRPTRCTAMPPLARNESTASLATACSYKRSKNSVCSKYDTPIRTSKPLPCSLLGSVADDQECDESCERNERNDPEILVKIADLGNATFSHVHFTNQIQTRQYRSPEIILRYKSWGALTDMWSLGCIIFELITGDFLFDPYDGKDFDKDEDHLAQIIELLGSFPSDEYLIDCKHTSRFFKLDPTTNEVVLKRIDNLKYWGLRDVLVEKYKFDKNDLEVDMISDLILKCLRFDLDERFDCRSLLLHPWLRDGNKDKDAVMAEMQNMENCCEDVPGYTGTWGDDEEEY